MFIARCAFAGTPIPNICKMPDVPYTATLLPNVGRSGDSPKGYSETVTISGARIAIEGATFDSQGDAVPLREDEGEETRGRVGGRRGT
ncbi:MAG: hypothetical protein A2V77_02460 [Anaeromyxobacter sp. RBG_16_69_14]|nr:MAG: hypothetical protein A2V77_02460 [Anaeromyxobacter sp. RBG_16_69_14]